MIDDLNNVRKLSDVLMNLKQLTKEQIKVCSLAYYDSLKSTTKDYKIVNVKPFPLDEGQEEFILQAYNLSKDITLNKNDIVLILYADRNFIENLTNNTFKSLSTSDNNLHQQKYAICLPISNYGTGGSGECKVSSVNGKTGTVILSADDVHAYSKAEINTKLEPLESSVHAHANKSTLDNIEVALTNSLKSTYDAKYTKPATGIPKTDLSSDVQTSLGKADTALQSSALSNYVQTTDPRLSDARTPLAHTHVKADITDFPTTLSSFTDDLGTSPIHTHSQYLTEHQDISGKQDLITVNNKLPYELVSGTPETTQAGTLDIDNIVTSGSNNLITSGAVYTAIDNGGKVKDVKVKVSPTDTHTVLDETTKTATIDLTSYLTASDISNKADKSTTLAGYGITDANIKDGVITLGANTITPLTSHQTLPEYTIVKESNLVYKLTKDGSQVGVSINIPKDLVIQSGSVITKDGKTYIQLVLNDEAETKIEIDASKLVDNYTGDNTTIEIDDNRVVKVKADVFANKSHTHAISDVTNLSTELGKKVDKVEGKGLSTNDYDANAVAEVAKIAGKQDTIADLATIRSGASAGATAVQDSSYVHTDNNYTTTEKTKLSGIATSATKVESSEINGNIKINGAETTVYIEAENTVHDASYVHTDNNYTTEEKTAVGTIANKAEKENSFYFVEGSSSQAGNATSGKYLSTKWEGTITGVSAATNGLKIAYRIRTNTGVGTAGAVLSIDGTNYYPVVYNINSSVTSRYAVGSTILCVFNATQTAVGYLTSNVKSTITGCWQIMDYDANSYAYMKMYNLASTNEDRDLLMRYDTTEIVAGSNANKYGAITSNIELKANPNTGELKAVSFTENGKSLVNKYQAKGDYAAATHTHTKSQITDFPTNVSAFTNDAGYLTEHQSLSGYATEDFVNSSIETATATFRGTVNSVAELSTLTADNNDYAFVKSTGEKGNTVYTRYKYDGTTWTEEYVVNNSGFTDEQWQAVNSGATETKINSIENKQDKITTTNKLDYSLISNTPETTTAGTIDIDTVVTQGSSNLITSGAVYNYTPQLTFATESDIINIWTE